MNASGELLNKAVGFFEDFNSAAFFLFVEVVSEVSVKIFAVFERVEKVADCAFVAANVVAIVDNDKDAVAGFFRNRGVVFEGGAKGFEVRHGVFSVLRGKNPLVGLVTVTPNVFEREALVPFADSLFGDSRTVGKSRVIDIIDHFENVALEPPHQMIDAVFGADVALNIFDKRFAKFFVAVNEVGERHLFSP